MKKINKYFAFILIILGVASCDDYLDVNEDPNNPIASSVSPNLSLAGAITQPYRTFAVSPNALGNVFMNSWGGNVNAYASAFSVEQNLNIDTNFYARTWEYLFATTVTLEDIINYDSPDYDNHKAIAKIVKAYYFQYLVDLYGDIPYSQAHKSSIPFPAYDDDEQVYRDLLVQLKSAIDLIDNAPTSTIMPSSEDVVYNGDMDSWKKLANTLKLKLLMRESNRAASQAYVSQEILNAVNSGIGFIDEDVTLNPGYGSGNADQQNPFYNSYGFLVDEVTATQGYASTRATKHATDFLSGITTSVSDERIGKIFNFATNGVTTLPSYQGIIQGEDAATANPFLSPIGTGLVKSSAQDGYLMLAAESYLLQAEAIEKGYMSGDAKNMFENAIKKSFTFYGLTVAQADTYIASSANTNKLGWDGSANKTEAIMTQKWIALMGTNGAESWIEYTRTGFPVTPLSLTAQFPTKPKRLMYPASEISGNGANVPSQTQASVFVTGPFWSE